MRRKLVGRSSRTAPKVVVLMGGPSAEREVSLSSGRECAQALRQAGYDVTELDAGRDLPARLAEIETRMADAQNALQAARKHLDDLQEQAHAIQVETLKLAQALDRFRDRLKTDKTVRVQNKPGHSGGGSLGAVQVGMLQAQAGGVRIDAPDAVHKARVATRRLRSLLKTFTGT